MKMAHVQCPFCSKWDKVAVGLDLEFGSAGWLFCKNQNCQKPFLFSYQEDSCISQPLNESFMLAATPRRRFPYLLRQLWTLLHESGYDIDCDELSSLEDEKTLNGYNENEVLGQEKNDSGSSYRCQCPRCQEEVTPPMYKEFVDALMEGSMFIFLTYCQECEVPVVVFFTGDYFDEKMFFCLFMGWDLWVQEAGEANAFATVIDGVREEFDIPDEKFIGIAADEIQEYEDDAPETVEDLVREEPDKISAEEFASFKEQDLASIDDPSQWKDGKNPWDQD